MKTQVYIALIATAAAVTETAKDKCAAVADDCTYDICNDSTNKAAHPFTTWKGCEGDLYVCQGLSTTKTTNAKCSWTACNPSDVAVSTTTYTYCTDFVGKSNDCKINGKSCTLDFCKDHQVADSTTTGDWSHCTYKWTRT
jgi:hypothetical protein